MDKEEEYIDIDEMIDNVYKKKVYQFQLLEDKCIIRCIGECEEIPEIIIEENFGKGNSFSMYSYIYEMDEITRNNNNGFLPLIRLVNNMTRDVYSIILKYKIIDFTKHILDCETYEKFFMVSKNEKNSYIKIEENIDSDNIIEKLLEMTVDIGVIIYEKVK